MPNRKHVKDRGWRGADRRRGHNASPALLIAVCVALILSGIAATHFTSGYAAQGDADAPRLSEVMTGGNGASKGSDWIEIENAANAPLDLSGYALVRATKPGKALTLSGVTLQSGERLVIYCDGAGQTANDGALHAPFKLAAAGETVLLLNAHGACVDRVTTPSLEPGQVYCRDAAGEWVVSDSATPGADNRTGASAASADSGIVPGSLVITEAMSRNVTFIGDAEGNHFDYVEIHNPTSEAVALKGWALSDSREKLRKWEFPDARLEAGAYLLVRCSGTSRRDDPSDLQANFRLNRSGETLWLSDADGEVRDCVAVPALNADAAWSLTDSGWTDSFSPTPGRANDMKETDAEVEAMARSNDVGVFVNELMASSGEMDDWIELYNATDHAVDLSGYGLSDNAARPRKWQFPSGTVIQPGACLGVFAGGTKDGSAAALRTDFALSASGGYSVTLSDPSGRIFDRLFVPQQYGSISYGRLPSMGAARYFLTATPGAPNDSGGCYGRAPQPEYSIKGGLYRSGDRLEVSIDVPAGCRVFYTTDCGDPNESSAAYSGPIVVTDTTILRTQVYREGYLPSIMDTQSYLYDVKNGGGTVRLVSVVTDPDNLYDPEKGIFVGDSEETPDEARKGYNANYNKDWERECHAEIFLPDGTPIVSQECGVKLFGAYSRSRPKKPLKLIARGEYGSNRFNARVFSRRDYTDYKALLLRTGSQDWDRTHMRDAVLQQLVAGTPMLYQEYEIAVLYLNGEYWGHYNIRERINPLTICRWEGWEGDEDGIDLVRGNQTALQGSNETMEQLLNWLEKQDCSTDKVYDAIDSIIDIDSYIEYIAVEMYTGNTDALNIKRYRNPKKDGKWHWLMFDLDCAFDVDSNSVNRWLDPEGMGRNKNTDNRLIVAFMRNPRLRERFLTYLGEMMVSAYSSENVLKLIEDYYNAVKAITPEDLARWNLTEKNYQKQVAHLVNYTKARPMRMLQFLKVSKYLGLTQAEMEKYFGKAMEMQGVTYASIKEP